MADYQRSKLAEQDFRQIARYTLRNFGLRQAQEYESSLVQAAKTAANFPSIGRPYTTKKGSVYQQYNVGRHALFYRATESGVFIVRVLHLMMDFDRHLD
jgi:toxin ParE1/3/4